MTASDHLAVERSNGAYTFTATESDGAIHLFDVMETAGVETVMMKRNYPTEFIVTETMEMEDFFTVSTGELGLYSAHADAFVTTACESPYSVTIDAKLRSYIEELS